MNKKKDCKAHIKYDGNTFHLKQTAYKNKM